MKKDKRTRAKRRKWRREKWKEIFPTVWAACWLALCLVGLFLVGLWHSTMRNQAQVFAERIEHPQILNILSGLYEEEELEFSFQRLKRVSSADCGGFLPQARLKITPLCMIYRVEGSLNKAEFNQGAARSHIYYFFCERPHEESSGCFQVQIEELKSFVGPRHGDLTWHSNGPSSSFGLF